jgi:hydrogenase nickel incorporation protein HypA/HybF
MHEVSLMENALEIALEYATRERAQRIHKIALKVGDLAGVEPYALRFAFDVVTQGTIAERAKLTIESCAAVYHCNSCHTEFQSKVLGYECPNCQSWNLSVVKGKELEIASLEVS